MASDPDPKPSKRVRDPELLRQLHVEMAGDPCQDCERQVGTQLHHVVFRSQGGDDVRDNLEWLCNACHDARHGL